MIEELKYRVKILLEKYKDNDLRTKRLLLIKQMFLEKNCFFKMNIKNAFSILRDLDIPEEKIEDIYSKLIDIKNYQA